MIAKKIIKKIAIVLVLLLIQLATTKSQAQTFLPKMSLDSSNAIFLKIVKEGWTFLDSLTASSMINTYLFYSVPENIKAKSLDYLTNALLLIKKYSSNADSMRAIVHEREDEVNEKDKTLLENYIQFAFPELQEYSAWTCIKFIMKNKVKIPVYFKSETVTKVFFGTPERNNDDGLFNLINCNVKKHKSLDTIAPMFDYYITELSPDYIVYNGKTLKFTDFLSDRRCLQEYKIYYKLAKTNGYLFPNIDKIEYEENSK